MPLRLMLGLGALVLAASAAPAWAEDQPPLVPTRDAAVTYQVRGQNGQDRTVHMFFDAREQRVHIDLTGRPGFLVIDHKTKQVTVVNSAAKAYVEMPAPPEMGNLMFRSPDLQFTRKGTDKIAGIPCTVWTLAPGKGEGGVACITNDGIVLSGHPASATSDQGGIKAVSVTYGAQPASLFAPPPGYQRLQPQTSTEPGAPPGAEPPAPPPPSHQP